MIVRFRFPQVLFFLIFLFAASHSCVRPQIEKKKVVYVNSYHQGFPPSDDITRGVFETMPLDSFEIVSYFMDSKRNPSETYIRKRTAEILDSIRIEDPDILIVSDDNAMKYLIEPFFQDDPLPIVFVELIGQQHNIIYLV